MKITYIDKPTYLPDWTIEKINQIAEMKVYDDLPNETEAIRRLSNTDIAIVEWTTINKNMVDKIDGLKYLIAITTSFDYIDVDALVAKGIHVSNCPTYSKQSVAEHVFALMLSVNRKLALADRTCREGKSHVYPPFLCTELRGKTLGIVGLGQIGSVVSSIARAFGMNVIGCSKNNNSVEGVTTVSMLEVFKSSDFISINLPHNEETINIVSKDLLGNMKANAILVNTSRGNVIDEEALYQLLKDKKIAGAGLDDLKNYKDNKILELDNVIFTPGSAWYSEEAREANMVELIKNIKSFKEGILVNLVN
ncbi:hypothetical protein F6Y02_06365 (plasmid) [Bacillus megaterium]|nr:hypothetical protein [Priestia megaterium]